MDLLYEDNYNFLNSAGGDVRDSHFLIYKNCCNCKLLRAIVAVELFHQNQPKRIYEGRQNMAGFISHFRHLITVPYDKCTTFYI